jgi:pseudaminic acid biosynthesis-associated methylase
MIKRILQPLATYFNKVAGRLTQRQKPLIEAADDTALVWAGEFGKKYTKRNFRSLEETEDLYKEGFGISRSEMNAQFLSNLDKELKILEVGSNIGNQLLYLQKMGFMNLHGIDVQSHAIELAKSRTDGIDLINASGFDIPFKDSIFDLVFTSGVLIHVRPDQITTVLDEIWRCTNRYIWGFEIYSPEYTNIPYLSYSDICYKADYAKLFMDRFNHLRLIKQAHFIHPKSDNTHFMYLLEKPV